jgi:hypothetical protein
MESAGREKKRRENTAGTGRDLDLSQEKEEPEEEVEENEHHDGIIRFLNLAVLHR